MHTDTQKTHTHVIQMHNIATTHNAKDFPCRTLKHVQYHNSSTGCLLEERIKCQGEQIPRCSIWHQTENISSDNYTIMYMQHIIFFTAQLTEQQGLPKVNRSVSHTNTIMHDHGSDTNQQVVAPHYSNSN